MIDDDDEYLVQDLPPPRLFCDICDVFDQHDTDDCPMQTMSDSPPHSMHHGSKAPGGSDRPYCENCESKTSKDVLLSLYFCIQSVITILCTLCNKRLHCIL